jgi:hypothetical protein
LIESFAFYLYVAYAEELSLEARPRRRFIPLPRVLRSLLVAAPAVPLVTVASLGALAVPTAAASVLVISGLLLKMRCSITSTSSMPPDGSGDGYEDRWMRRSTGSSKDRARWRALP